MNREEFRKALDAEREILRGNTKPLPPWARKAVTNTTVFAFLVILMSIALIALGFVYMAFRILAYVML